MELLQNIGQGLRTFASDVAQGFFEITHNGFALLGLVVVVCAGTALARPDLRQSAEVELMGWLQERHIATTEAAWQPSEPGAIERATATNPAELPKQQAAVAFWLSKKYRVAPEPLGALVAEAYEVGRQTKLDPTLILAIMAVESGFNPFAQSTVGAQGLMQVMTRVHTAKYDRFGGTLAAFDPVTNLKVGVKVLQECIARAGSIEGGLRHYVGDGLGEQGQNYALKVLAEHARLFQVATGRALPPPEPRVIPAAAPAEEPQLAPVQTKADDTLLSLSQSAS
ncbi:lytic transglycosylase domain-containing protein [Pseudorhodoferax soli]|uniref:Transglycosylase-like protein with SLT domain n=1 Tax=Pseudorhodoferax soli TaxID=545864 RepID=A0A368Y3C9_9BURK|nr:lytic transglycosylase domain-containing protein [Pseudorhodoferax soli]RCW73866.1 transglycosylase-like protein with SLT domain [Pseudorhodoferax soli]